MNLTQYVFTIFSLLFFDTILTASEKDPISNEPVRIIRLTHVESGKMVRIKQGEYITFKYGGIRYEGCLDSVSETAFFTGGKAYDLARLEKIKAEGKKAYMKHTGKVLFSVSMLIAGAGLIGYIVDKATDDWGGMFFFILGVYSFSGFTFTFLPGIALYFIGNEFQYYPLKRGKPNPFWSDVFKTNIYQKKTDECLNIPVIRTTPSKYSHKQS